jgi:RNA polymerase sigma-70 factor (ECF subfamily)
VSETEISSGSTETTELTAAIRAVDEEAFNHLAARHRPSLYRVATNVWLDAISRDERQSGLPIPPHDAQPEAIVLSRDTIEIAFLTVLQLLTPQQRAALILCDVLGWSATEAAALFDVRPAAVDSALQRARMTLQRRLLSQRSEWPTGEDPAVAERELLKKYVDASENADLEAFTSIIRDDATFRMPPQPRIAVGRDAMFRLWVEEGFGSERFGRRRSVPTRANLQPAVANYVLGPGQTAWKALALDVLRIEGGVITEIVTFPNHVFPRFDLPLTMEVQDGGDRPLPASS